MEQISQNEVASCQDIPQRFTCCSLIVSLQSVQFSMGLRLGAEMFVGFHFECEVIGTYLVVSFGHHSLIFVTQNISLCNLVYGLLLHSKTD